MKNEENNINTRTIQLKSPLEMMNQAYIAQTIMKLFRRMPCSFPEGVKEIDIAEAVTDYLKGFNYRMAAKGFKGFPADISISRNHVIAHGIPSDNAIENGDVLTIDVVCEYQGWYADMSWTYFVGNIEEETRYLLDAAWDICRNALNVVRVGNTLKDVAYEIQQRATKYKVHVYNQFVGHGIGRDMHELPFVRYDKKAESHPIQPGMVLCIEPIISLKPQKVYQDDTGAYIGVKRYATAVYEHMVGVLEHETKVLSWGMEIPSRLPSSILPNTT